MGMVNPIKKSYIFFVALIIGMSMPCGTLADTVPQEYTLNSSTKKIMAAVGIGVVTAYCLYKLFSYATEVVRQGLMRQYFPKDATHQNTKSSAPPSSTASPTTTADTKPSPQYSPLKSQFIHCYNAARDYTRVKEIVSQGADLLWDTDADTASKTESVMNSLQTHARDTHVITDATPQVVGFVTYYPQSSGHGYIYLVATHAAVRGQGYASKLMRQAINNLSAAGAKHISLSVQRANPARAQYERMGFEFDASRTIFRSSIAGTLNMKKYEERVLETSAYR